MRSTDFLPPSSGCADPIRSGYTQPPVQWRLETLFPDVKIKNAWGQSAVHLYAVIAWCLIMPNYRDNCRICCALVSFCTLLSLPESFLNVGIQWHILGTGWGNE
jgi:hypothetical protein